MPNGDFPPIKTTRKKKGYDCETCGLDKGCRFPRMGVTGEGRLGILILGEASGENEDLQGTQFVGDSGQLLREKLAFHGLDLDRDFYKINVIGCRPPGNRTPKLTELKCCYSRVQEAIRTCQPKMIWLLGSVAIDSFFLTKRFDDKTIGFWRNRCWPDLETDAWVLALFHPSYLLRNKGNLNVESVYDRDLAWAVRQISRPPVSFPNITNKVKHLLQFKEVIKAFDEIEEKADVLVFDYETTGSKPERKGHQIACSSFCWDGKVSYCFPYSYPYWNKREFAEIQKRWVSILKNPKIKKAAQNLKFEERWSRRILGTSVASWKACTMNTSHILDVRPKSTGLKFQAYVRWGIYGYDASVGPYLKAENANAFNKVMEAPLEQLMEYCGLDSLFEYWLMEEQEKELTLRSNQPLEAARKFNLESLLTMADVECNGIPVDDKFYQEEEVRLTKRIDRLEWKLKSSEEANLFFRNTNNELDFGSNKDLGDLLFKWMKIKPLKQTDKGHNSVDAEALDRYSGKVPIVKDVVAMRKLKKIRDTYLAQYKRESVNGKIYSFINLHIARSFRSSVSDPNMQNTPIREEEAKRSTRSGIIPSKGYKLREVDYGSLEVRIAACYNQDPSLVAYILDPSTDMHRDQAELLFKLKKEEVTKDIRFYTKNMWVFPQFYGSYYVACARDLWRESEKSSLILPDGKPLSLHMADSGLYTYESFEAHLRRCEYDFWNRFKVFREWQEQMIRFYLQRGYIQMFHGFRRGGVLKRNEIINTCIQGSSFHCLLWSLKKLNDIAKKENWKTKIILQIHDSIIMEMHPSEEVYVDQITERVMTQDIRKEHSWITVPLVVEFEGTDVDQSWYHKKELVREAA